MIRFVNPGLLVALLAAGLPVVVHLLWRDRIRRVAFSSLRFLRRAPRHVLRRKLISEVVLVILRTVACVLAVLVFCRPFRGPRGEAGGLGRAVVVAVDTSASMQRLGDPARLQDEVSAVLDGLGRGDAAALISFDRDPVVRVALTTDRSALRAAVAELAPGHGGTDLAQALQRADALVREVRAPVREIVLVSDLQRAGWQGARGDWRLAPGVELSVRPLAPATGPAVDLAITRAEVPRSVVRGAPPPYLAVRLANRGPRPAEAVPVILTLNDQEVARQTVTLPPDGAANVRFRVACETAGDNLGTVSLGTVDLCPDDDHLYFNTRVIPRLPVLLIGGPERAGSRPLDTLLRTALVPAPESPLELRNVGAEQVTPADVAGARVVILADVAGLPQPVTAAIDTLVRENGGGLLALPGSRAAPDSLPLPLAEELAPCRLRRIITPAGRAGEGREIGLVEVDFTHPVFQVFQRPRHGDFTALRFRRYWEVTGSQLSRVLARFEDGRPAILEREAGAGMLMVWLAPPDPDWGNLPGRAIFLPLLHQTVRYLSLRTEAPRDVVVGDLLPTAADETVTLPDGTTAAGGGLTALRPGFYRVARDGAPTRVLTANTPATEAGAATIPADELRAALVTPITAGGGAQQAGLAAGPAADRGLWQVLLVILLAVLLAELWVANRVVRN